MTVPRIKAGLGIEVESIPSGPTPPSSSMFTRPGPSATEADPVAVNQPVLRSSQGMQGLLSAEKGEGMVEFDVFSRGSGFREGQRIAPESVTPGGGSYIVPQNGMLRSRPSGPRSQLTEYQPTLSRQETILGNDSPIRASQELKTLLGDAHSKLKHGATVTPRSYPAYAQSLDGDSTSQQIALEQTKSRARVEVDIILESNACVQGSLFKGVIKIHIRKCSRHEPRILIAEGKVRIIGFECISNVDDRHTFYQCVEPFSTISSDWDVPHESDLDQEGFAYAREGTHSLPFAMHLPLEGVAGNAKGSLNVSSGVSIRYIAMVSVKVKDAETGRRSIAHFYRDCEVWPRLDPSAVLAPAPRPLQSTASKSLFMGGSGNVKLTALLSRLYWVAGQRCYVKIIVNNNTKRTIKSLSLHLVRTITVFRPRPELDAGTKGDPDACHTATSHREVAGTTLVMAQRASKGHASTKGWWTGVDPGEKLEFSHFILLPVRAFRYFLCFSKLKNHQPEALSVARSRLLEVEYCIRVSISAGPLATDVFVDLPIRIINFMSIDVLASDSSPYHPSCRRSSSRNDQHNLIDGSLPAQSRSKSDIGSLMEDKKLGRKLMDSRSLSTGRIHSAFSLHNIERCENDHLEADVNRELGNLEDANNSDEEVNFVIGTATTGQVDTHLDSYIDDNVMPETLERTTVKQATDSATGISGTRKRSKTMSDVSRKRSNSFAARVQEKIMNADSSLITTRDLQDHLRFSYADVATPKPKSGWSGLKTGSAIAKPCLDDLHGGSSPSTCSIYTNTTVVTSCTANPGDLQSASFPSGSDHFMESKSTSLSNLGIKGKSITERAEALKQSISSNGVTNESDHGAVSKTLADRTSEVKKRIEALEAKMRNS